MNFDKLGWADLFVKFFQKSTVLPDLTFPQCNLPLTALSKFWKKHDLWQVHSHAHSPRSTSGATPANISMVNIVTK